MDAIDDIVSDFELLGDWDQRYQYLVELGEGLPEMPPPLRSEENRVQACMSKVWVSAYPDPRVPGHIRYYGDCDTAIIKGVVGLLVQLFSGLTPRQVLDLDVDRLFERIRLGENLSPNRHVGVYAIVDQMKAQAERLAGAPVAA
jgi:cysteine desulfuration protein SufE